VQVARGGQQIAAIAIDLTEQCAVEPVEGDQSTPVTVRSLTTTPDSDPE
jgi:hypothetical protein